MAENTKKLLYTSFIRTTLTYPPIALHTAKYTNMIKMQRVQNRAVRFIKNVKLSDRLNIEHLHDDIQLPPINIILHLQAKRTWTSIEEHFGIGYIQNLITDHINTYTFPSSYRLTLNEPAPIYR